MRRTTWLVTMGAALAIVAAQAIAQASHENSQQQRMTSCNADATAKGLKGTERKSFMKSCLSEKSTAATTGATAAASGAAGSAAAKGSTQQEKMKTCSADARSKGLKGADRKAFMKGCLSGSAAH
jgi:hypothetical protein